MGIFDRFRRNKADDSVLPAEVDEYYQTEQRDRRGVALLLGIITLIITLLIAVLLFHGARFVYRKITQDNNQPSTVQVEQEKKKQEEERKKQEAAAANQQSNPSSGQPTPTPGTPPASSPSTPAPGSTPTPSTGDDDQSADSNLPRTGDEGM